MHNAHSMLFLFRAAGSLGSLLCLRYKGSALALADRMPVLLLLTSFLLLPHDRSLRFFSPLKLRARERIFLLLQIRKRQHAAP